MKGQHPSVLLGLIVTFIAIWFVYNASIELIRYTSLDTKIEATLENISIQKQKKSYSLVGNFSFDFKNKSYIIQDSLKTYPNFFAAKKELKSYSKGPISLWVDSKHPEKGRLIKAFPYKSFLSATLLIMISIYFFSLSVYIKK